jgi:hypothetical protein
LDATLDALAAMSGFAQIGFIYRCGALCRRAQAEIARKFKKPKTSYIYNSTIGKKAHGPGGWVYPRLPSIHAKRDRVSDGKIRLQMVADTRRREARPGDKAAPLAHPDSDANPKIGNSSSHWKQARSDTAGAAWKACWDLILAD